MEFWGVELKPKKPYRLNRVDYGGTRLHISQATLGGKMSTGRSIVRCKVGDGSAVYLCSLLPSVNETSSLDLYFEDDIILSVKGNTSVHLVGYFEPFEDANCPGDDCEEDGYSDEDEEEEMSDDDSMNDFIVGDEDDSDGEDVEYDEDDDESTSDEDEPIMVPNKGVTIEEMSEDDDVKAKNASEDGKSIVPVKGGNKKNKKSADAKKGANVENGANGVNKDQDKSDKDTNAESEDEDGFPVNNKRKLKDDENDQPSKKRSTETREDTPEPTATGTDSDITPMKTDTPSESAKKKKKKKNKKDKKDSENADPSSPAQKKDKKDSELAVDNSNKKGTVRKFPNGLEVENVSIGKPDGKQAQKGRKVGMIYTGRLKSNGKIFDSNVGKKPFFFRLGMFWGREVIKGWDVGVTGMRVGDKRKLTIPPQMAYGAKSIPGIPGNSWLVFDVELVEVK